MKIKISLKMKESKIKVNRSKLLDRINLFKETIKEQDEYTNHLNIMLKEKEDELDELEHKMQFLIQSLMLLFFHLF